MGLMDVGFVGSMGRVGMFCRYCRLRIVGACRPIWTDKVWKHRLLQNVNQTEATGTGTALHRTCPDQIRSSLPFFPAPSFKTQRTFP
jgi:hypothetical protein